MKFSNEQEIKCTTTEEKKSHKNTVEKDEEISGPQTELIRRYCYEKNQILFLNLLLGA